MLIRFFKTIRLPFYQIPARVVFHVGKYATNDNLYIEAYKPRWRGYECWDDLTVNTGAALPPDCACIDVNKHGMELIEQLEKKKLGVRTEQVIDRGYCSYPVFRFRLDKIRKHTFRFDV